ncbi:MFS transporter [Ascidiaceihabitans sp.]|nr:MFS transporter [Ascidiaceihabitans sp.]
MSMSPSLIEVRNNNLPAYAVFAAMLSAAGLPIYIHAPKYFVDEYGVSLVALGSVLFILRLLDVVQDPFFGRLSARLGRRRGFAISVACVVMALGMLGLFAVEPLVSPLVWFGLMLTLVFSAFSFLTINFYAQGVVTASSLGQFGHLRLARWRESGALFGVCIAAIAPLVFLYFIDAPFVGFAIGFAVLALVAGTMMRAEWAEGRGLKSASFQTVLQDPMARQLLIIAFINAAPVAVSSTLFLFFVETRLLASGMEGPLLLLFFLSAALSVPLWGESAERFGTKNTLMVSMTLAIVAFAFAIPLGAGDWVAFAFVCVASGAALGADLTLLPAIFAKRMAEISPAAAEGFGLWSFVSKFTLAFAAVLLLPALQLAGFESGSATNSEHALFALTLMYAAVPCILKIFALILLACTAVNEE